MFLRGRVSGAPVWVSLLVVVTVMVVHWPVVSSQAVYFDDDLHILENPVVQHPTWSGTASLFTRVFDPAVGGYYKPLPMVTFLFDTLRGGSATNHRPYHETSLVFHALNVVLLYVLIYLLFRRVWAAGLAALLFGLHPANVQAVAWMAERKTLMAATFALAAMILYVLYAQRRRGVFYVLSLLALLLGLMSKPTVVPLPLLLLVLDYWPLGRVSRRALLEKVPYLLLAIGFGVIAYISQSRTLGAQLPGAYGWSRVPLLVIHAIGFHFGKLLWPVGLSPYYPVPSPFTLSNLNVAMPILAAVLLGVVVAVSTRWTRALAAGALFFVLALLPAIGVVKIAPGVGADRHLYLPAIGVLVVVGGLLAWLRVDESLRSPLRWPRGLGAMAALAVVAAAGSAARQYAMVWKDSATLLQRALAVAPNDSVVRRSWGTHLARERRYEEAEQELRASLALDANDPDTRSEYGAVLMRMGRTDEALQQCRTVVGLHPQADTSYCNLGAAMIQQRHYREALAFFRAGVKRYSDSPGILLNLGVALVENGRVEDGIDCYRRVLEMRVHRAETHYNLGVALGRLGRYDEALGHYREAVRLDAKHPEACGNLGILLLAQGRAEESLAWFTRALNVRPALLTAMKGRGAALVACGRGPEAVQVFKEVLALQPRDSDAREYLTQLKAGASRADTGVAASRPVGNTVGS